MNRWNRCERPIPTISRSRSRRRCGPWPAMTRSGPTPPSSRLLQLLDQTPLEPLPSGTRPNSRQRAVAARLIPLWVVARACWKQPSAAMHALGDRLAVRALDAASRQSDTRWVLAMLREQGQLALDHNDKTAAEAVWSRMLNMVVAPEPAKSQTARPGNRPAPAPARSAGRPRRPLRPTTPPTSGRTRALENTVLLCLRVHRDFVLCTVVPVRGRSA